MRTRTRIAGGVAAVLLCAGMPASASSPKPVVLGGTVTLTGTTSFVRDVTIPRPVHVTYRDFQVKADAGRFAGVVLDPVAEDQPGTAMRIDSGFCVARGCRRPSWGFGGAFCFCGMRSDSASGSEITLPAGRYRIYLVADGARVSATVSLPGLKGRTTLTSGTPVRPVIDVPAPDQLQPPISTAGYGGNLYGAGSTHDVGEQGVVYLTDVWKIVVGAPRSANPSAICLFDGTAPPSFAAPCPGARENLPTVYGQVPTDTKGGPGGALDLYAAGMMSAYGLLAEGMWSLGGYIETAAPATEAHTVVFWLDLV